MISADLKYEEWMQEFEKEIQKYKLNSAENIKKYVADNEFKMTKEAVPICFDDEDYWNCYLWNSSGLGVGFCHNKYNCKLEANKPFLDECFNKTVKMLYDWRSKFVHDAEIPPIGETAIYGGTYKKKSIVVELTTEELKPVFEKMVKRYFDQYQGNNQNL